MAENKWVTGVVTPLLVVSPWKSQLSPFNCFKDWCNVGGVHPKALIAFKCCVWRKHGPIFF